MNWFRQFIRRRRQLFQVNPEFFLLLSLCIAGMAITLAIGYIARILFKTNPQIGLLLTIITALASTTSVCWVLWQNAPPMRSYLWLPILLLLSGAILAWT